MNTEIESFKEGLTKTIVEPVETEIIVGNKEKKSANRQ